MSENEQKQNFERFERYLRAQKADSMLVLYIDLKTGQYQTLHCSEEMTARMVVPETGDFWQLSDQFANSVVFEQSREEYTTFSSKVIESLSIEDTAETEFQANIGNRQWWRIKYNVAQRGDIGEPLECVLTITPIDAARSTELRQQQALKEAFSYAESANAAKTEFFSKMSHNIRTPMNAIIGMTAIAATNLDDPARVKDCLNKISHSSKHLLGLINEVLDMSKIESGSMQLSLENFSISEFIDSIADMVIPIMEEHQHKFDIHVGNIAHEDVIGDSMRLSQILINLVSNSAKYTPKGGEVTISVCERPTTSSHSGIYEFVVKDNGIGMSEEFQKKVFEPFARAEDVRVSKIVGTGLGMTITKNLVHMMDGNISVKSEVDKGTEITVQVHMQYQHETAAFVENLQNLPVLVVDDDEITCTNAVAILDEIGMTGEVTYSGAEAIGMVDARHKRGEDYFAVLMDWKMPGMNGIEATRQIREKVGTDIPIIILTAYDWAPIEKEGYEAGVTTFITKPLFKSRLIKSFQDLTLKDHVLEPEEDLKINLPTDAFKGKHIMLVEDNDLNAEIAIEVLEQTGVVVDRAENGQQAVEMFAMSVEGDYDLILMDVQMPIMNGYEATHIIRDMPRSDSKLPIVAMTANAFAEDVVKSLAAGMNEHISKPIEIDKFNHVMAKYLNKDTDNK